MTSKTEQTLASKKLVLEQSPSISIPSETCENEKKNLQRRKKINLDKFQDNCDKARILKMGNQARGFCEYYFWEFDSEN